MKNTSLIFYVLLCSFLFSACKKANAPLPIEEEKLKEILIDVHVAEAALQPIIGAKKDSLRELYFSQIFEIHEIHAVEFEATMELLQEDPKRMKKIYKELTEDIPKKKLEYRKKQGLDNSKKSKTNSKPRLDNEDQSSN